MPRGDGSGPMGEGPMTGRAAGSCAGNEQPDFAAGQLGRGGGMLGRGGGMGFGGRCAGRNQQFAGGGRGYRNRAYATGMGGAGFAGAPVPTDPATLRQGLEQQATALQNQLDLIQKRLAGLTADNKEG